VLLFRPVLPLELRLSPQTVCTFVISLFIRLDAGSRFTCLSTRLSSVTASRLLTSGRRTHLSPHHTRTPPHLNTTTAPAININRRHRHRIQFSGSPPLNTARSPTPASKYVRCTRDKISLVQSATLQLHMSCDSRFPRRLKKCAELTKANSRKRTPKLQLQQ
jgi:hypothetical protein